MLGVAIVVVVRADPSFYTVDFDADLTGAIFLCFELLVTLEGDRKSVV